MGSKKRIAKHILPIILKNKKPNQFYVEPFVGGGNCIEMVTGHRIGADRNKNAIDALIFIRDNLDLIPKDNSEFTEEDYKFLRKCDSAIKPFAGFAYSYAGKWLGGWRRDKTGIRDYVKESYRAACKQSPLLQNVKLIHSCYQDLTIPSNSIIYCDPPYKNTTSYANTFDHDEFWNWCQEKQDEGHEVFISEYEAPVNFECVWEKEVKSSLTKNTGNKKATEKLFTLKLD